MRWFAVLALAGCRWNFDAVPDAAYDGVYFPMDDDPRGGVITAVPAGFSVACAPCPTPTPGRVGGAYHYDGTLRTVLGHPEWISLAPFTVAVWIRAATTGGLMSVVNKPLATNSPLNVLSLKLHPDGKIAYEASANGMVTEITSSQDGRDAWHHVALRWNGTHGDLFVDALPEAATLAAFDDSALDVGLGADLDNGAPEVWYTGAVDELRIYPRALADAEIAALAAP